MFRRQRQEWTEFLRRYVAELQARFDRAGAMIDRARAQPKQMLGERETENTSFRSQREVWTDSLRQRAAKLRDRIVRRFWKPVARSRFWGYLLLGWCCFAAIVLLVSLVAHVSTFLGIDPMTKWPSVMNIHLASFLTFFAALFYLSRNSGKEGEGQVKVFLSTPRWLRILTGVFFAYGLVNFGIFMFLNEGGGPDERDGKYFLTSHGKVLRELSEAEYHRQQAYVVRGFSGHWMMFSCASLTLLVGTAKLRRHAAETPTPAKAHG